jgi:hypothetical protein
MIFLVSGFTRCTRLVLYIYLVDSSHVFLTPVLKLGNFSNGYRFLLLEKGIRNEGLCARCAHFFLSVINFRLSAERTKKYMCEY